MEKSALLAAALRMCISSELLPLFLFYLAALRHASVQWALQKTLALFSNITQTANVAYGILKKQQSKYFKNIILEDFLWSLWDSNLMLSDVIRVWCRVS